MKVLSIDIGGTSLKYSVIENGKMLFEPKFKNSLKIDVKKLLSLIGEIYSEAGEVDGLAISSPGAISNGVINNYTAIKGLEKGYNLPKQIKEELGIKVPISILNDANAYLFGEYGQGAGKGFKTLCFFGIGSGIGGGIIVNNEIIHGSFGFGGEFGAAIPIWNFRKNAYDTPHDHGGFYALSRNYEELSGESLTGKEIFDRFDNGDKNAIAVIEEFYDSIVKVIWCMKATIDPEVIIFGGGLAKRKTALKEIEERFMKHSNGGNIKIEGYLNLRKGILGDNAPILGAYHYFIKSMS